MPFVTAVDIANRALQHVGARRITTLTDASKNAAEVNACYNMLRDVELRRNTWKFTTRRVALRPLNINTQTWTPAVWNGATNYALGAVVYYVDANSNTFYWERSQAGIEATAPDASLIWHRYCGPLAIDLWLNPSTTGVNPPTVPSAYYAGEIVIIPTAYIGGTTYTIGNVVTFNGFYWVSLTTSNTGNQPDISPTKWTVYTGPTSSLYGLSPSTSTPVPLTVLSGSTMYRSLVSGNNDEPVTGAVAAHGPSWILLGGTITPLRLMYPIGSGPLWDTRTKNAFRLPYGYLRKASQNPNAAQDPWLGAPSAPLQLDWVFENDYLVTSYSGVLVLRFVADIIDVPEMDPMFCEGLACRIAYEVCETLTQSAVKLADITRAYRTFMREARVANLVETGEDTMPRDEYLSARF